MNSPKDSFDRDEHGGWSRDENVEFESDDEDYIPPS